MEYTKYSVFLLYFYFIAQVWYQTGYVLPYLSSILLRELLLHQRIVDHAEGKENCFLGDVLISIPTSTPRVLFLSHIFFNSGYCEIFYCYPGLLEVKWYFMMTLSCFPLITNIIKYILICSWTIHVSSSMNCLCLFSWFDFLWLIYRSLCYALILVFDSYTFCK